MNHAILSSAADQRAYDEIASAPPGSEGVEVPDDELESGLRMISEDFGQKSVAWERDERMYRLFGEAADAVDAILLELETRRGEAA